MLTVYRASAGAGKTHRLTGEYLKLLFIAKPFSYRHILAVTFTNKATDEMKTRIIDELYHLAAGHSSDYLETLMAEYRYTEQEARQKAKKILVTILHDYAAFNISTIDRFFQQTMRAFTREIGLQGGYGIEMDQDLVLSEAIDTLLADLEKPERKELLNWLLRFAEDKVESGGEWNLRREIMSLSREVFKESYKSFSNKVKEDIQDKKALENYKNDLYAIIHSVENEVKGLGEKGMAIMRQYGLQPTDFKGGSNSPLKHFDKYAKGEMKEPSATFINLADNVDACYTKTTSPATVQIIGCAFDDGLNDCIKGVVALFGNLTTYYTAKEIVRYYYTLGILNDVSNEIAAYREDKNIMLIADTTELLNKVIDGSDAPFIYEKTGTHIDHYMIDEFQDTSGMQWNNFLPLIKESLAHKQTNLIVGDVKQSIYRFRNSDWKLLEEQVKEDFSKEQLHEETLKDNWRSFRNIVEFNNALFTITPELLQVMYNDTLSTSSLAEAEQQSYQTKIVSAYKKSYQLVPPKFRDKGGHVKIQFLSGDDDMDWKEEALQLLPTQLEQLQDNGYKLRDIAVLVRTNLEGAMVAEKMLAYKEEYPSDRYHYDIISDDALFVGSSASVRFILALMRHLKNPEDIINRQMALVSYMVLTGRFADVNETTDFPLSVREELQQLSHQPLYELTEGLFRLFAGYFPDNEQVFIQAFMDMVSEFLQKESADLSRFLKWWDESGYRKTIATPDDQNAIRILTVHKSKGLGFKVVIVPFGDWEIDHRPTKPVILWCRPKGKPFDRLHLAPVRYGQVLSKTIFAEDYFEERLHAYIDNLNTLYVAFTRAKEELIVFCPKPKKVSEDGSIDKITSIADLLWTGLYVNNIVTTREGESLINLSLLFDYENAVFELGTPCLTVEKEKEKETEEISMPKLSSVSSEKRLQLRLHGQGFFFDNPTRKHGVLMHEILSAIRTEKDIRTAVEDYRLAGIINGAEASELARRIEELLVVPEVSGWYDGTARVMNEVEILYNENPKKRPDRVMIFDDKAVVVDYKFGEQEDKRHYNQVRHYKKLIRQMNYRHVEGYLWYVELNKIVPVGD